MQFFALNPNQDPDFLNCFIKTEKLMKNDPRQFRDKNPYKIIRHSFSKCAIQIRFFCPPSMGTPPPLFVRVLERFCDGFGTVLGGIGRYLGVTFGRNLIFFWEI